MKRNAPPWANTAARGSSSAVRSADAISPKTAPAQESTYLQLPIDGVHLATIWRSPRDRSRAIQFALKEYGGHRFLDVRQYVASSGFMVPTPRGLTLDVRQLGKFAAAAGAAYRQAIKLDLITAGSSS